MHNTVYTRSITRYFSLERLIIFFFVVLLLFGRSFTKFNIIGPLYLHDLFLLVITIASLFHGKLKLRFFPVILIVAIAVLYLCISLLYFDLDTGFVTIAFRQFALFFYLACSYIVFNTVVSDAMESEQPLYLIRLVARMSVFFQIFYLIWGYLFIEGFSTFQPEDYRYFSPLAVMGIIVYGAMVLTGQSPLIVRSVKFLFVLFLSTTVGHSSAFLALFVTLIVYLFVQIRPRMRLLALASAIGVVLLLALLPQFRDANAGWRLLYWKHVLDEAFGEKFFLLGSGFGKPYMSQDHAWHIYDKIHSTIMIEEMYPLASYLSPPHNSLLTMVFHIGFLPALLFFLPLKNAFQIIFFRKLPRDSNIIFLILALVGSIVWICFNVILELPHSATYFWLIYFSTVFYIKYNHNLNSAPTKR